MSAEALSSPVSSFVHTSLFYIVSPLFCFLCPAVYFYVLQGPLLYFYSSCVLQLVHYPPVSLSVLLCPLWSYSVILFFFLCPPACSISSSGFICSTVPSMVLFCSFILLVSSSLIFILKRVCLFHCVLNGPILLFYSSCVLQLVLYPPVGLSVPLCLLWSSSVLLIFMCPPACSLSFRGFICSTVSSMVLLCSPES